MAFFATAFSSRTEDNPSIGFWLLVVGVPVALIVLAVAWAWTWKAVVVLLVAGIGGFTALVLLSRPSHLERLVADDESSLDDFWGKPSVGCGRIAPKYQGRPLYICKLHYLTYTQRKCISVRPVDILEFHDMTVCEPELRD